MPTIDEESFKRFANLNIAVMDSNAKSAQTTRAILSTLGVYQFRIFRNANEMLDSLQQQSADVIVADLGLKTDAELEAIQAFRYDMTPLAFTPIIAMSAYNTASDVKRVIDAGASELIAKPASVKNVFNHLQTIINNPRSFVATKNFKGPDRRRKTSVKNEGESREQRSPAVISNDQFVRGNHADTPSIIMPDFSLKMKMSQHLVGVAKQDLENEFLFLVLSDIATLEMCESKLAQGAPATAMIERICTACLSIQARASVYEYSLGAEIARQLWSFCHGHFNEAKRGHHIVVEKHIQILSTIFNKRLRDKGGNIGQELQNELSELVRRYI